MKNNQQRYFEDPWRLEFEAQVLQVERLPDGRLAAILESSYFYPTSGGQEHDTGFLGSAQVVDVFKDEERGLVMHVIEGDLSPGMLPATIDKDRRLRHAQHHTAQHLLTQCFIRRLGLETVSANIKGYSPSTLDLAGEVQDDTQLEDVENLANQVIFEDRPVKTYFVSAHQASSLPLHKPPAVTEDIRIVEIDGYDYAACGGTHVSSTGMIGLVKILRLERMKEKTRIYFVTGSQALELFRAYHNLLTGLSADMSVGPLEVGVVARRTLERLEAAQKELGLLRQKILASEAGDLLRECIQVDGLRVVLAPFKGRPPGELRSLAGELSKVEEVVALLATHADGKVGLVVACGPGTGLSAQALLKPVLARLNCRGGGDALIAQGGGLVTEEDFDTFVKEMKTDFPALVRQLLRHESDQ
jgi:alanyl-tRNA synthetase